MKNIAPFGVAFFGVLLVSLSVHMVFRPGRWSRGIVRFSKWRWFHPAEVISRFIFGVMFLQAADLTRYPTLMNSIGYLLIAVSVGLLLTPPSRHRAFAVWSAAKFRPVFRPAGAVSTLFGIFLVYAALR